MPAPIITLLTDFGGTDGYVGAMKGVILGICPAATIVDLSHGIARHDVAAASFVLGAAWRYFPTGTIHVVVVDPDVGSARRALAMQADGQRFVGPDNGVFTQVLEQARQWAAVELTEAEYFLASPSHTFHGRDIFAPVAAHLASGAALEDLGAPVEDPMRLAVLRPEAEGDIIRGHVVYVDSFGDLVTDIRAEDVAGAEAHARFEIGHNVVHGVSSSYAEAVEGQLLAIVGSWGMIEIATNRGSARERIGARPGDRVLVYLAPPPPGV